MKKTLYKPHYIFAFFSLLIGMILVFLIPPIGGIDESQHVRRVVDIANFKLLEPLNHTEDPLAIWAENALVLQEKNVSKLPRWNFFGMLEDIKKFPEILPEDRQVRLIKNPYAVQNPLLYLPFAAVLNISNYFFSPALWEQFYILRLTSLFVSVFLIAFAIYRMPEHKFLLSALCLLPAMMNARSGVNIDGIVIGSIFLFISQIYRLLIKEERAGFYDILWLVIFAFIAAQGKGAYFPILFLAFFLPDRLFSSARKKWLVIFITVIPALFASIAWSSVAKEAILSGISYYNENGEVWPDGQFSWILSHPFSYMLVVIKTIFTSFALPKALWEMIGSLGWGHNFISVPVVGYVAVVLLLVAITAIEPVKENIIKSRAKCFGIIFITLSIIGLALTMLYVQWSAYQSDVIKGFQGRYLYPLFPLLMVFVRPIAEHAKKKKAVILLWLFAIISSASTLWANWHFYYGL